MDIEQIYTIKDHSDWWIDWFDWFEIDWLIDWALVSQIYLVQQDEEHGHYFFYNGMKRKKKRKLTLVKFKKTTLDTGSET